MFLTLFVNTQREPLCEYVFNRCAKVFIFLRFSKPRRRIAYVFSSFLGVGWPRLAELEINLDYIVCGLVLNKFPLCCHIRQELCRFGA